MTKKIKSIVLCMALSSVACTCNGQQSGSTGGQDDAVAAIFGDEVAKIISAPKSVNVYTLKKAEDEPSRKVKIIDGYEVVKELKKVPAANYSVLQFLLKDTANYQLDSLSERKCYFIPYLAYEFVKGKDKATVLMAFNCECMGILYKDKLIQKPYRCHRDLLRLSSALLPDDKYLNKLLSYFNE